MNLQTFHHIIHQLIHRYLILFCSRILDYIHVQFFILVELVHPYWGISVFELKQHAFYFVSAGRSTQLLSEVLFGA